MNHTCGECFHLAGKPVTNSRANNWIFEGNDE